MKIKNKKTKIFLISLGSLVLLGGFYVASAAVLRIIATSSDNFQIPDIEKGLIGYWPLDQDSLKSSTITADATPYGHDGTITAGTGGFTTDNRGVANRAYDFDGAATTIPTTLTATSSFQNGFTISAWIKPESIGSGKGYIVDKADILSASVKGFTYGLSSINNRAFLWINSGTIVYMPDNSLTLNTWQHVLVTIGSNATVTHYLNGVQIGTPATTGALSGITTANPVTIGNRSTVADRTFDGGISDVRIYNRVLSAAEAQSLYQSYRPSMVVSDLEKGLIARFPLDAETKQSTITFTDTTPNAYIGTITPGTSAGLVPDQRGVASRAYDFDGNNTHASTTLLASTVGDNFTVTAWVKADSFQSTASISNRVVTGHRASPGSRWAIGTQTTNGTLAAGIVDAGGSFVNAAGTSNLSVGVWYHIAMTYDGSNVRAYLNGVLNGGPTAVNINAANAGNVRIGIYDNGQATQADRRAWNGYISDVRIYNRVLSAIEVQQLYQTYQ